MALSKIVEDSQGWLRCGLATDDVLRKRLLAVFHKDEEFTNETLPHIAFSRDPKTLYNELLPFQIKLKNLKYTTLKPDQWDLLYPASGETKSDEFDITLLGILIKTVSGLTTLNGKQVLNKLDRNDNTILSFVIKVLHLRNHLYHFGSITKMTLQEENDFWNKFTDYSKGLLFTGNVNKYKTVCLDPRCKPMIDTFAIRFQIQINDMVKQMKDLKTNDDKNKKEQDEINDKIHKLKKDLEDKERDTKELYQLLSESVGETVDEKILELTSKCENSISKLRMDLSALINDLEARVTSIEGCLEEFQTDQSELINEINTVKCTQSQIKSDLAEVKSNLYTEKEAQDYDLVTKEILDMISAGIGDKALELSNMLIDDPKWQARNNYYVTLPSFDLHLFKKNSQEIMSNVFMKMNSRVIWEKLKNVLVDLECHALIARIENKEIITQGDRHCSQVFQTYQQYINKTLNKGRKMDPLRTNRNRSETINKSKDIFVELLTGPWEQTHDKDIEHFERMYQNSKPTIKRDDIVQDTDDCIVMRGIAGIGKTSLLQSLLLDWSDEDDQALNTFHFVIKIDCRELNIMRNVESWQDILQRKCPKLFSNDLSHHTGVKKILFLIDGIDEYRYLDDLKKLLNHEPVDSSPANGLYELFNPHEECFKLKKTILLSGRPRACEEILSGLHRMFATVKCVEVNGFNNAGVDEMIERYPFADENRKKSLSNIISNDKTLYSFMHIPAYADSICFIYNSSVDDETSLLNQLNTTTNLSLVLLLVHIRKHMLHADDCVFSEMIKKDEVVGLIKEIAKYAYVSLNEHRIVFQENEMSQCIHLLNIENSGIIVKYENGEENSVYQFSHFTLQELFAAIHILCEKIDIKLLIKHQKFENALLMYFGLLGLFDNEVAPKYLTSLVQTLSTPNESYSDHYEDFKTIIENYKAFHLFEILYEYHKQTSEKVKAIISNLHLQIYVKSESNFKIILFFMNYYQTQRLDIKLQHPFKITVDNCTLFANSVLSYKNQEKSSHNQTKNELFIAFYYRSLSTSLNDETIKIVAPALALCDGISLRKSRKMTSEGWETLCQAIKSTRQCHLKLLDVSACRLDDETFDKLASIVPKIEEVVLSENNNVTEIGWTRISEIITESHSKNELKLKKLVLRNCAIDDKKLTIIAQIIPLIEIGNLNCNSEITEIGWHELAKNVIKSHRIGKLKLNNLSLCACQIDDKIVRTISPILPLIGHLKLRENENITDIGWDIINKECPNQKITHC